MVPTPMRVLVVVVVTRKCLRDPWVLFVRLLLVVVSFYLLQAFTANDWTSESLGHVVSREVDGGNGNKKHKSFQVLTAASKEKNGS